MFKSVVATKRRKHYNDKANECYDVSGINQRRQEIISQTQIAQLRLVGPEEALLLSPQTCQNTSGILVLLNDQRDIRPLWQI